MMAPGIMKWSQNWQTARSLSPWLGERAVLLTRRLGDRRMTPASSVVVVAVYARGPGPMG